jgi:hypothetical protein
MYWDMMLCNPVKISQSFGEIRLHIQGLKVSSPLLADSLHVFLFGAEGGGDMFLRRVG